MWQLLLYHKRDDCQCKIYFLEGFFGGCCKGDKGLLGAWSGPWDDRVLGSPKVKKVRVPVLPSPLLPSSALQRTRSVSPPPLLPQHKSEIHLSPVTFKTLLKIKNTSPCFCFCFRILLTCTKHQSGSFSESATSQVYFRWWVLQVPNSTLHTSCSGFSLNGLLLKSPFVFISVFAGWNPRSHALPSFQPPHSAERLEFSMERRSSFEQNSRRRAPVLPSRGQTTGVRARGLPQTHAGAGPAHLGAVPQQTRRPEDKSVWAWSLLSAFGRV